MGFSDLILGLMGAGTAIHAFSAYKTAKDDQAALHYQAVVDENNAQLADNQARDAITRGQMRQAESQLKTGQLEGRQRNIMAASGVDLSEGSPFNVLVSTKFMGDRDAATIATNAGREAWGFGMQSQNYRDSAKLRESRADQIKPWQNAAGTLLTDGGTVAAKWYQMDKGFTPSGTAW